MRQFAILALLVVPVFTLVPASIAAVSKDGLATLTNSGAHGFSEILYAFSSATGNNGSAFGGLAGNTFYDFWTGVSMFFGRFGEIVAVVALAGALCGKKAIATTAGTFTTTSPVFVALLIGVILIVGALTFFPADALGPSVDHLQLMHGKSF